LAGGGLIPVARLAIATFMVREAIKTLREETYQA